MDNTYDHEPTNDQACAEAEAKAEFKLNVTGKDVAVTFASIVIWVGGCVVGAKLAHKYLD